MPSCQLLFQHVSIRWVLAMVRTQIQLTKEQADRLRRLAAEQGRPVAELVREAVEQLLRAHTEPSREERRQRALAAVGRFCSGFADVAVEHDRHLSEAFGR